MAFVDLVNNEQLDEAAAYLRTALKYQPGNQRYSLRIAEILAWQDKFAESAAIADKIARTADEPEIKARAENLTAEISRRQKISVRNEAARRQYDAAFADAGKNGAKPVLIRRTNERTLSPEEAAKAEAAAKMFAVNQAVRKAAPGEKQITGRIQKIECKGKSIT